jgi:hypothetical protein
VRRHWRNVLARATPALMVTTPLPGLPLCGIAVSSTA